MNKLASLALAAAIAAGFSVAATATTSSHAVVTGFAPAKFTRADDTGVDQRHGRGTDDVRIKRMGADNPPGDDRKGRHRDDIVIKRQGADDPPGDDRRGRGNDDGPGHH